jgi:3-isopropylmalate/(R)-2-methylmalate dehydratase large subunit
VCHRVVVEDYALPGDIIVLTDSHTPTAGVLNAFAFGVGSTAMAFALRTGLIPVTVPKVVRVEVTGDAKGVLSPKDLILHLIGDPYFREEHWRRAPPTPASSSSAARASPSGTWTSCRCSPT